MLIVVIIGAVLLLGAAVFLSGYGDRVSSKMMEEEKKTKSAMENQKKDQKHK